MKVVKDNLFGLLVDLLLLPQDDAPLPLDRSRLEQAALEDVADDLDTLADVGPEGLGVVDGLLARGVGVEVRAEVLDLELEAVLGPLPSALEGHVLEEVGDAGSGGGFGTGAGIDPDAHGGRGGVRGRLGRDGEAVGEGRNLGEGEGGGRGECSAQRSHLPTREQQSAQTSTRANGSCAPQNAKQKEPDAERTSVSSRPA